MFIECASKRTPGHRNNMKQLERHFAVATAKYHCYLPNIRFRLIGVVRACPACCSFFRCQTCFRSFPGAVAKYPCHALRHHVGLGARDRCARCPCSDLPSNLFFFLCSKRTYFQMGVLASKLHKKMPQTVDIGEEVSKLAEDVEWGSR